MACEFGWVLHANDEGLVDGERQVTVNWVMPARGAKLGEPGGIAGADAFAAAGDLMWPWKMHVEAWHGWTADGWIDPPVEVADAPRDAQAIQEVLEAEIYNKCAACKDVFSMDAEHLQAGVKAAPRQKLDADKCGRVSLPHVFASLTHLPADISHGMLGMTRSFLSPLPGKDAAWLPRFTLKAGEAAVRFVPDTVTWLDQQDMRIAAAYRIEAAEDSPYGKLAFSVLTKMIAGQAALPAIQVEARVMPSEGGDVFARALRLAVALAPLPLLGELAGQLDGKPEPAPDNSWPAGAAGLDLLLARSLGPGLLRMDDGSPVMIWERLPGATLRTGDSLLDWWKHSPAVYEALERAWTSESGAQSPRLACLAPLFAEPEARTRVAVLGRLMADSASARVTLCAWLSAVALTHAPVADDPFWRRNAGFGPWFDQLAAVVGDHELAELQAGWWRHWLKEMDPAGPDELRLDQIAEDWIAGDFAESDLAAMRERHLRAFDLLVAPARLPRERARALLDGRLAAARASLRLPAEDGPSGQAEDAGLAIGLAVDASLPGTADEDLRGYAIALGAGIGEEADARLDWAWLTNVIGKIKVRDEPDDPAKPGDRDKNWDVLEQAPGEPFVMHDSVGATTQNGRAVTVFPYKGAPLNGAMRAAGDTDGIDNLGFVWPAQWKLPQLAFGLRYFALATAINNSGKILDPRCADPKDERRLAALGSALFGKAGYRYLCRVAPGAVTIKARNGDAYDMEEDSRSFARWKRASLQGGGKGARPRVAVIRPKDTLKWRDEAPVSLAFDLLAPDATPMLVARWIETDIAVRTVYGNAAADMLDPYAKGLDASALRKAREALLEVLAAPNGVRKPRRGARHPAVRALAAVVRFEGEASGKPYILKPASSIDAGYLGLCELVVSSVDPAAGVRVDAGRLAIALQAGQAVGVTVYSLVPEAFFAGSAVASPLPRMASFPGERAFQDEDGTRYRGYAGQEHWFECAPGEKAGSAAEALAATQQLLEFAVDGADVIARVAGPGGVDARWIKGFLVQRHEWHWTGYPLALPRMLREAPALHDWAEAFIGVESLRETFPVTLETEAASAGAWRFGSTRLPAVLLRHQLPQRHGARFIACILRPLRRFAAWLPDEDRVESKLAGAGRLVAAKVDWQDPGLRLAPPTVRAIVPLVRTYEAAGTQLLPVANGALVCLDDAICRTDAMARFGGVGEIIDVTLEESRVNGVNEIGLNPTMHAGSVCALADQDAADGEAGVRPPRVRSLNLPYSEVYGKTGAALGSGGPAFDWDVVAERPFGLSFDTDRNARVAQTALVVRPIGTAVGSYWIMAKVRLRRLLDPDDAWTADAGLPRSGEDWLLGRRPEGDQRIPYDFAVDGLDGLAFRLALGNAPGALLAAPGIAAGRRRLLCSWHKGLWNNTGEAVWGVQVQDQVLEADRGQWRTVQRYSPYETRAAVDGLSFTDAAPAVLAGAAHCRASRLLLSDYGEAHWLSFIGTPYRHMAFAREAYAMALSGKEIVLSRSAAGGDSEIISRDLLVNPVQAADFEGTPGSDRVGAERHSFHLLLVFQRVDDVAVPREEEALGQLAGVYKPVRGPITEDDPYPPLRFADYDEGRSTMPPGAVGFLYKFQSVSDPQAANPDNWSALMAGMFPADGKEARVRWLPEFLGPIRHGSAPNGEALDGPAIRIELDPARRIDLTIDQLRGWSGRPNEGARNNPWPRELARGTVTFRRGAGGKDRLDIEGAGGRLLAQLEDWTPLLGGRAVAFDGEGRPVAGTWRPRS